MQSRLLLLMPGTAHCKYLFLQLLPNRFGLGIGDFRLEVRYSVLKHQLFVLLE